MTEAVLLLIFNRPETTKEVLHSIQTARPRRLYVAADGPRAMAAEDATLCEQARRIATDVDWECEVRTLFRAENLGCQRAVSSAIDWFFANEEQGIILEDDCIPDSSFYGFCEILLERYRNDMRVSMIAGTNYLFGRADSSNSYYFSRYYTVWGWATWRRAWKLYDNEMTSWLHFRNSGTLRRIIGNASVAQVYTEMLDRAYSGELDTWAVRWLYSCLFESTFAIVPTRNLVSNIGIAGTHTLTEATPTHNMPTKPIVPSALEHPYHVFPNEMYDAMTFASAGLLRPWYTRAWSAFRSRAAGVIKKRITMNRRAR